MKKEDFVFDRIEGGKYCDYWFNVIGETKEELTKQYMEQSMIEVTSVVFSMQDGQWGVRRQFPFNYDVITPMDTKLYEMIKSVAFETLKKQNKS